MSKNRRFIDYLRVSFAGFAMGVANVIPGVSGGTMAFILGVFEELVEAIKQFASKDTLKMLLKFEFKKMYQTLPWRFLLAIAVGVAVAFAGVSKLFIYLLANQPTFTFAFFFGLIIASIVAVGRKMKRWSVANVIAMLIGAGAAYAMITLVPISTPNVWYISFLCGVICICAMILPGVSGSFLLLVLGQYQYVWGAVGDLAMGRVSVANLHTIFWLGVGAVIGVGAFSHLLTWLFKKHNDITVAALIGFMVGSVPRLWPWQEIVEYSVKTKEAIVRLQMPQEALQLKLLQQSEAKITPLVVDNIAPKSFGGEFWGVVGLIVLGVMLVLVTEYVAAKSRKNEER